MKIVVLDGYTLNPGDLSWEKICSLAKETYIHDRTRPEDTFERCKGADIVLTNKTVLDAWILKKLPQLKFIGILATGYNVVDIKQAMKQNIIVTNVPAYSSDSVAQMVFAHILTYTNNVAGHSDSVKSGKWTNNKDFCYWETPQVELKNKNIGVIGLGNIGIRVAQIAIAFGMKVYAYTSKKNFKEEIQPVSIETLFKISDILTLHCPLTEDTKEIINAGNLSIMKKTSMIINTGRGGLINEKDLAAALNNNIIAAAGIDVLSNEPPMANNPLLEAKNCTITPHIAWATKEARIRLMDITYNNIKSFIDGKIINRVC